MNLIEDAPAKTYVHFHDVAQCVLSKAAIQTIKKFAKEVLPGTEVLYLRVPLRSQL